MPIKLKWWPRRARRTEPAADTPATPVSEPAQRQAGKFARLPEPVDPKDMTTSQPADAPRDPRGGRDTERDFLLRYGAGGDDTPWDPTDG